MSLPTVVITGGSGFVASEIIHQIRTLGKYNVRTTVRNPSDETKVQFLRDYGNVEIASGDLLKEGSFDEAFKGAKYVIHTASPFFHNTNDPENDLLRPAIEGTKNVLNSALKNQVKRVVLTSSMAAICGGQRSRDPNHVWVEEDWNNDALVRSPGSAPYPRSKTLAELAAWEFVSQHPELELVVINPSFVLGPPVVSRVDPTSISSVKSIIEGTMKPLFNRTFGAVDVRTVAKAHINALEIEKHHQRFIVSNRAQSSIYQIAQITKKLYPDWPVSTELAEGQEVPKLTENSSDNSRAIEQLGVEFYDFEKTIKDMYDELIRLGSVKKPE